MPGEHQHLRASGERRQSQCKRPGRQGSEEEESLGGGPSEARAGDLAGGRPAWQLSREVWHSDPSPCRVDHEEVPGDLIRRTLGTSCLQDG